MEGEARGRPLRPRPGRNPPLAIHHPGVRAARSGSWATRPLSPTRAAQSSQQDGADFL